MKKRAMKKWIPKGSHCYDSKGGCKWLRSLGYIEHNRFNCEYASTCDNKVCNCKTIIMRCDYLGITDENEDTLLWDACKECCVKEGNNSYR